MLAMVHSNHKQQYDYSNVPSTTIDFLVFFSSFGFFLHMRRKVFFIFIFNFLIVKKMVVFKEYVSPFIQERSNDINNKGWEEGFYFI